MITRQEHELEKHLTLEIFILLEGSIQLLFKWEWMGGGVMGVNAYYIPQDGKERKGHFKYNTQG